MSDTVSLNHQFYQQNETVSNAAKKPPIPLPRKISSPDIIKDSSLHVVPLSSDEDSSFSTHAHNIDTDVSDVESPQRLQRSGTFTKLAVEGRGQKSTDDSPAKRIEKLEVRDGAEESHGEKATQLRDNHTSSEIKAENDDRVSTPVISLVATVEDLTVENHEEKHEHIEAQVQKEKEDSEEYQREDSSPVNELFMVEATSIIRSLEPPADSTDFSGDVGSLTATRKRKKKKLTKKVKHHSEETELKEIVKGEPEISKYDYDHVVGITIHESDLLLTDGILKPLVEVHVINQHTGQYLTKQQAGSNVDDSVHVSPLQTQVFDFHTHRSITPKWEEQLVLSESPSYIFSPDTVLLFELLDRSGHKPPSLYNKLGNSSSVGRVAWAFLVLIGANGAENINKKIRLQLYRPRAELRADNSLPMYKWFRKFDKCTKLRNSLYVTVRNIQRPSPLSPTSKSKVDLQSDGSSLLSRQNNMDSSHRNEEASVLPDQKQWQWSRLQGESCKVPNRKLFSVYAGSDGTLAAKFSPNGLLLAVARQGQVYIYTIPDGAILHVYNAHSGLIYNITWYEDSSKFLTTSADRTVCVWSLSRASEPILLLPHPCYVYDALFILSSIVTCCYDGVIRVWRCTDSKSELVQEMSGHDGYVNAMCYNPTSRMLYSGDSQGVVITWHAADTQWTQGDSQGVLITWHAADTQWTQGRTLLITGLHGIVINTLLVYGRSCLIVHSQDSVLRMIDAISGVVLQWYKGCVNDSINTGCTLSPCRSLLFCASEDGNIYVWESHSGVLRGVYLGVSRAGPLALHYHPQDHMLLMGGYEIQACPPITVLSFVRGESGKEVGLHLMSETQEKEAKPSLPPLKKTGKIEYTRVSQVPTPDKLSNIMHAMDEVLKSVT